MIYKGIFLPSTNNLSFKPSCFHSCPVPCLLMPPCPAYSCPHVLLTHALLPCLLMC